MRRLATMPESNRPQRKAHRLVAQNYAQSDCCYFFTLCARQLGQPFLNCALARAVIESLLWTRNRYDWDLYSYCLMPDHLHFVCRLKKSSGRTMNAGARGNVVEGVLEHVARFKSFTTKLS